jgi:transposase
MARPTKFDQQKASRIIQSVGQGATFKDAAAIAGISYDTLNNWRGRGLRDEKGGFFEFCHALTRAEAEGIESLVRRIHEASETDWRAAAWLLERRRPEVYGRKALIEHTGSEGKQMPTSRASVLTSEMISDEAAETAVRKFFDLPLPLPPND